MQTDTQQAAKATKASRPKLLSATVDVYGLLIDAAFTVDQDIESGECSFEIDVFATAVTIDGKSLPMGESLWAALSDESRLTVEAACQAALNGMSGAQVRRAA